jgi:DNA (cytosine-5)-methyltransferase 1
MSRIFTSVEICAGAGGQAIGLDQAGFEHLALVELEHLACQTLRYNKPEWNIIEKDLRNFSAAKYQCIDLLAGGVPCPPFSIAGKQLGKDDERDLFPEALRLVRECSPKAVMLENVKGILSAKFEIYRNQIIAELNSLGYQCSWKLINSSDYGVSQLRPRAILVALKNEYFNSFKWPEKSITIAPSVGELLYPEITSLGWDALPPAANFTGMPRLTLQMTALIQGFPSTWKFAGKKTPAYRQVGNAFPPPVAKAVGKSIISALKSYEQKSTERARIENEAA